MPVVVPSSSVAACVIVAGGVSTSQPVQALPAGRVLAPETLPGSVTEFEDVEQVGRRRGGRLRRLARRGGPRFRGPRFRARRFRGPGRFRGPRRFRAPRRFSRRFRGPRFSFPRPGFPYLYGGYYYNSPWWESDYYYYGGYDYVPPVYGGRCERWRRRCGRNWGYNNPDFRGCMRYHGC